MAKKTRRLSVHFTDKEQIWTIVYLLFSYFLLPELLGLLNTLLPLPLRSVWINFLYFTINFLCVFGILHKFFQRSLVYAGQNVADFLVAVVAGTALYFLCILYRNFAYTTV